MTNKIYEVNFMAGEGRDIQDSVNFMLAEIEDIELYAEIALPEDASEDYGYLTLKDEILKQAAKEGIEAEALKFWYDGQEQYLAADARA